MAELIDCRGLSCPEPVLQVRRALQETGEKTLHVLVSSAVARDNVKPRRCRSFLGGPGGVHGGRLQAHSKQELTDKHSTGARGYPRAL